MKYAVGIDVGGTNTRVALINDEYKIVERVQFSTDTQNPQVTLEKINNVIKDFTFYENSYDDGERDIIGEYEGRYGNYNIIEWYEGLKSTKSFLEDFKLERDDYSV